MNFIKKNTIITSVINILKITSVSTMLILSINAQASHSGNQVVMNIADKKMAQDIHNNTIEFPNPNGKWMIINYWAQWCGPCRREIPELNKFYHTHKDRILLVSVNSDLLEQKLLQKMAKELKIQFPILQTDPMKLVDSLEGTPSTYLISPSGQVYGPLLGPQTERSLLRAIKQVS